MPGGPALAPIEENPVQEMLDLVEDEEVERELEVAEEEKQMDERPPQISAKYKPAALGGPTGDEFDLGEDEDLLNEQTIEDPPYIGLEDENSSGSSGQEESEDEPETPKPRKRAALSSQGRKIMPSTATGSKGKMTNSSQGKWWWYTSSLLT